jgi:hypothetical protein
MAKKSILFWSVAIVGGLYTTFVIQNLWNWFVIEAFHLSQIPFWVMYGVVLTVGMFTHGEDQLISLDVHPWYKTVTARLEACVPDDKLEFVNQQIKEQKKQIWVELGALTFGKAVGNTFTFVIGWAVHAFLA